MGDFLAYELLPVILNMTLTASVVIVLVLLAHLALRRAPRICSYALWLVVLFRLLCPVSLTAGISLMGLLDTPVTEVTAHTSAAAYVPQDVAHNPEPSVTLPVPRMGEAITETLPQGEEQTVVDPLEAPMAIATIGWLMGVIAMVIYGVVSLLRLRQRLVGAVPLEKGVYLADHIGTPFVLGLFRPKIYLPSALPEGERVYILLHERHHIRRLDHVVKLLAFLSLCIHWFNPLVWLMFVLLGRDMEMSCDEAVMKKLGEAVRADYSASLLRLATGRKIIAGAPLAFGEGDTRDRVKNVLRWKRPRLWAVLAGAAVCAAVIVACAVNPQSAQDEDPPQDEGPQSSTEAVEPSDPASELLQLRDNYQISLDAERWELEEYEGYDDWILDAQGAALEIFYMTPDLPPDRAMSNYGAIDRTCLDYSDQTAMLPADSPFSFLISADMADGRHKEVYFTDRGSRPYHMVVLVWDDAHEEVLPEMREIAASFREIGTEVVSMDLGSLVQQAKVELPTEGDAYLLAGGASRLILDAGGGFADVTLQMWALKQSEGDEYYCGTLRADGRMLLYQGAHGMSTITWPDADGEDGSPVLLEEFASLVERMDLALFLPGICAGTPAGYEVEVCPDLSAVHGDASVSLPCYFCDRNGNYSQGLLLPGQIQDSLLPLGDQILFSVSPLYDGQLDTKGGTDDAESQIYIVAER